MPKFIVRVAVRGTETCVVDAVDADAAWHKWYDGDQVGEFEAGYYDVIDVDEMED